MYPSNRNPPTNPQANTDLVQWRATDKEVAWLWEILRSFTAEQKALFLQFITGTARVPVDGFKSLQVWMDGWMCDGMGWGWSGGVATQTQPPINTNTNPPPSPDNPHPHLPKKHDDQHPRACTARPG